MFAPKKRGFILFIFVPLIILGLSPLSFEYSISGKGVLLPASEWVLERTDDGNLMSSLINNATGTTDSYQITEFQRGDVANLQLNTKMLAGGFIKAGDTIATILSNEEQRNYIQLLGQLEVLNKELIFYTTGQKPEDVETAAEQLKLAQQELETERKLLARSKMLFEDSVISLQDFEIAENTLQVKAISAQIAAARYQSAITGEKPEQEQLLLAKIDATTWQLEQVKQRLANFSMQSPFNGIVLTNRGTASKNTLVRLADTTNYVAVIPLEVKHTSLITPRQQVTLTSNGQVIEGFIAAIDNTVQFVDGKQAFFVTVNFPHHRNLKPGQFTEFEIHAGDVSAFTYLMRTFGKTP